MNKNLTEIVCILDESGSMAGLEKDTIGGFNAMIQKQKKEEGKAFVTTLLFSTGMKVVHDRLDVREVPPMTDKDYCPGGCTALLDTVGTAIQHFRTIHKYARPQDVPGQTLFVITTDGMENASHQFSAGQIREMIGEQKKAGWEFLFLGANIDALSTAEDLGIGADRAANFHCDTVGTRINYQAVCDAVSDVRASRPLTAEWKREIDADFARRKK